MENPIKHEAARNIRKIDVISAALLFSFGMFVFITGLRMPVEQLTHDPHKWYLGPGFFPEIIGGGLIIQALVLLFVGIRESGGISGQDILNALCFLKSNMVARFFIALGLLALYIFLLLRFLPYTVGTFTYLTANMIIFRTDNRAIWKLLIICLICSVVVAYGFSHFAKIPLP